MGDVFMEMLAVLPLTFLLAVDILGIAGLWRMLVKMGMPGWVSLIPVYRTWAWGSAVCGNKKVAKAWFFLNVAAAALTLYAMVEIGEYGTVAGGTGLVAESTFIRLGAVSFVLPPILIVLVVVWLTVAYSTAKAFGKGLGFTILLLCLPPIGTWALGWVDPAVISEEPLDQRAKLHV